jgi:hypothetical protein
MPISSTPRGQHRLHSALESAINVLVGYGVAVAAQIVVFPWFGIHIPLETNLTIGLIFTAVSLVRSYALRRAFNWWYVRRASRHAH